MKNTIINRLLPYSLWLLPVAGFYGLLIQFGQNIPCADDFSATLHFIYAVFFTGKSLQEQWLLLISQHNEHRIVVSRLMTLALYGLTGHVNLNVLLWVQQLFWLAFVGLVAVVAWSVNGRQSAWRGLPVVLLLFHPNTFDTLLHVWGGSQTYPVVLFTTLSLFALHRSLVHGIYWRLLAVAAAGVAMFSFGSGFLVWLGGIVYLFYCRRFALMGGWILVAALLMGAYLWQFDRSVHNESVLTTFRPVGLLKFVLLFPGAPFMARWPTYWPTIANLVLCYSIGLMSWGYTVYLLITKYGNRRPLLFSLLVFALSTGVLIAVSRSGYGAGGALVSRYQVFANLVPMLLYLIWTDENKGTIPWLPALNVLLISVQGVIIWQLWPVLGQENREKTAGLHQWAQYQTPTLCTSSSQQSFAALVLKRCAQSNICTVPIK